MRQPLGKPCIWHREKEKIEPNIGAFQEEFDYTHDGRNYAQIAGTIVGIFHQP